VVALPLLHLDFCGALRVESHRNPYLPSRPPIEAAAGATL
jgi:hypothetical protein